MLLRWINFPHDDNQCDFIGIDNSQKAKLYCLWRDSRAHVIEIHSENSAKIAHLWICIQKYR